MRFLCWSYLEIYPTSTGQSLKRQCLYYRVADTWSKVDKVRSAEEGPKIVEAEKNKDKQECTKDLSQHIEELAWEVKAAMDSAQIQPIL